MIRPFRLSSRGVLTALALFAAAPLLAQQPSFDCTKASTPTEFAICGSPTLAQLDREIAAAYTVRRDALGASDRAALLAAQRDWLATRDQCGGDPACIEAMMRLRLSQIGPAY
ncbi:lysozyme inhibitor LprI family protein [Roseovarius sp. C7]|uniref:lysozyme inhibitor LprI family protein n=1 Tax=Roseovarius sp. C7 TaxID=3398643 RepID=UPI0039F5C3EE